MIYKKIKICICSLLIFLLINNCIAGVTSVIVGIPIDTTRNRLYYKNTCELSEIKERFYNKKYQTEIKENFLIIDLLISFLGIFALYPNGLQMAASFLYASVVSSNIHSDPEKLDKSLENKAIFYWLFSQESEISFCGNYLDFAKYHETIQIELNNNKNNSQLTPNISKEILKEICFEKSIPFDNTLHQKIISIYSSHYKEENKKFKLKKIKNPKLDFKKYIINAEWDSVYAGNTKYLNCELEYFIYYKGGKEQFEKDHFVIEK